MSSQATIRSLYRNLLRELPPRPGQPRSLLHNRLRESFSSQAASQRQQPHASAEQADQFVQYLQAQRQYVTLIERYNPGMGMDEEERTRLTARRVGMDLPVEYSADEIEGEEIKRKKPTTTKKNHENKHTEKCTDHEQRSGSRHASALSYLQSKLYNHHHHRNTRYLLSQDTTRHAEIRQDMSSLNDQDIVVARYATQYLGRTMDFVGRHQRIRYEESYHFSMAI
ncbi:hypothetical protein PG995_009329 [Apiospora arundinis]